MMSSLPGIVERVRLRLLSNPALLILIVLHTVVCCVSLVTVSERQFYISYNPDLLAYAIVIAAAFSSLSLLFVVARFSFGYFVGFYFYTLILGFLWIDVFTKHNYDRKLAGLSAAVSLLVFLGPALLIRTRVKQIFELSPRALEHLLSFVLVLALGTILVASTYNFRLVSLSRIYDFRDELGFPAVIRYLIGITSSALLPFAFACYWTLNYRWRAAITLLLLLLFYPITLSKFAFFTPAWIVTMLILSRVFEARKTVILSLFIPLVVGLITTLFIAGPIGDLGRTYFNIVNIRMIAAQSSAIDIYNEYFSYHPHTYFCQISFLKSLVHCPYQDPLSVVMDHTYGFGNLNASLFATEGIASVGLLLAPIAAFACGLVIAFGNRLSAGLPPRFVLISGALLPQDLMNVPLTTALLTHGAAFLFLLWYITPRVIFASQNQAKA
ncbi:hypothetical protein [Bradyrhizobium canariense]|uniref:Oligosaccharide repeat unit polymerase n=1 Tax=Bradyrhizobium canariense TaxID=255045 RepID=A0A1H1M399_9BRAD|nr:hypothetical protein [Bradyrhizobium canariense]SDR81206.1 hypothetical protein SAMN05444158_0072 [Bradyrhizobium canariense]